MRLLIADDHEIVRMGVRILLSDREQWDVCGEARDGAEAIEKVMQLEPDVVVLDLSMPVMGGFDTARRIRHLSPSTRIVFFSIHETPTTARLVGADAFVSKASAAKDLAQTIRRVVDSTGSPRPVATPLPD